MTIKLLLLKSGEDIISDISEMVVGEDEVPRVIGYYLKEPCVVKIRESQSVPSTDEDAPPKPSMRVSLINWMPLSDDKVIPVPADWVITMVEPKDKLKDMYIEEVVKNGKDNQSDSTDESSDAD